MKRKPNNRGFTLIEILLAMVMVTVIFAMVYGTHSTISRTVKAYTSRRESVLPVKKVIQQIARQIRCSYAPSTDNASASTVPVTETNRTDTENKAAYFSGYGKDRTAGILRLVTTSGISTGQHTNAGMFEVAYKFDKATGVLFYDQKRFVPAPVSRGIKENWWPVAKDIEQITLQFFDGRTWLKSWDWNEQGKPPEAVSIEITLKGEHNFRYQYETVAYVHSGGGRLESKESKQLAAARK